MYEDADDLSLMSLAVQYLSRNCAIPDTLMQALKERDLDKIFTADEDEAEELSLAGSVMV